MIGLFLAIVTAANIPEPSPRPTPPRCYAWTVTDGVFQCTDWVGTQIRLDECLNGLVNTQSDYTVLLKKFCKLKKKDKDCKK